VPPVLLKTRQLARGWMGRVLWAVPPPVPAHLEPEPAETIRRVRRRTMTSYARLAALVDSVEYIAREEIPGGIVECGVWRGGSMMAAALTLLRHGRGDRDLYLFDTFEGMPEPTEHDVDSPFDGYDLRRHLDRWQKAGGLHAVAEESVREAMLSTGYPAERIHVVKGPVEDTLPGRAPAQVALLRLDTDWYQSTKHELETLYDRLSPGGVLILDDYGHYQGARQAAEEFFAQRGERPLLQRLDYTARLAVKR
jgi:O-methyltransferase